MANGIILARLAFDYEQPLDYREEVAVGCRIARMGRKSFDFAYEISSETRQVRAAHRLTTMVAYDYETKSSIVVPKRWREIIAAYEVVAPSCLFLLQSKVSIAPIKQCYRYRLLCTLAMKMALTPR